MDFGIAWLIIVLPIASFMVLALFGNPLQRFSKALTSALAVLPLAGSFGIAALLVQKLTTLDDSARTIVLHGPAWIDLLSFRAPFELIIDPLSMTMALIVTGIGSLIFLYSTGYMAEDKDYSRFFAYLSLFAASMLILVLGNNLPLLFVGWEGVGLCSYLLIGFWYKDVANVKAANKAFIVNRIGDWGLMLGLFLIFVVLTMDRHAIPDARYLSYDTMIPALQRVLAVRPGLAEAIAICLFIGACGKSAQFPLYFWLPDAMAGPTPVSALIHAATMVTSGVVLVNRMHIVFELAPMTSGIMCMVGAFTALFAAVIAFGQTDIKKVLAYSTVSQLGFMFIACGAGGYWAGMFHVATHAFFKALLFLGAGAVIHAMGHDQDMRNYGRLGKYLPLTFATMAIGWLAISGVPLFAGFYSKEAILHSALSSAHAELGGASVGALAGYIGLLVAILTAAYMTRLMFLTFFGNQERWTLVAEGATHHHDSVAHVDLSSSYIEDVPFDEEDPDARIEHDPHGFWYPEPLPLEHEEHHGLSQNHRPKEVPITMWVPLVVLALLSLGGGFVLQNNEMFKTWLYPHGLNYIEEGEIASTLPLMPLSIGAALLGIIVALIVYRKGLPASEGFDDRKWTRWQKSARDQFGYDAFMTAIGVQGGRDLADGAFHGLEHWVVDGAVRGTSWLAGAFGELFRKLQTGYVRFYALIFVGGVVCLLGYVALVAGFGGGH